jgi:hypothetical protein
VSQPWQRVALQVNALLTKAFVAIELKNVNSRNASVPRCSLKRSGYVGHHFHYLRRVADTLSFYQQDLERKEEEFKEAERKRRREEYYR